MLLERIDIDSCGSLDRIQLGPFSHRLNAVFGPPGSGKTATIEFVRSVMLGTDRMWHQGCSGRVVWSTPSGLLHCRREADGTANGRLSLDIVDRNGFAQNQRNGFREGENYGFLDSLLDIPRQAIDTLVAPRRDTSLSAMIQTCRSLGLLNVETVRDEAEIQRVRNQLSDIQRQISEHARSPYHTFLAKYPSESNSDCETKQRLEDRRRQIISELERVESDDHRVPLNHQKTATSDRRERLEVRLSDAQDEVARLRIQESDLRRSLRETDHDLSDYTQSTYLYDNSLRIATARRSQLEELDNQLMRLGRTLREIRAIRENWRFVDGLPELNADSLTMRFYSDIDRESPTYYRSRLESARRHLDWLLRFYDNRFEVRRGESYRNYTSDAFEVAGVESFWLGRTELESLQATILEMIDSLGQIDHKFTRSEVHNDHLRRCETTLCDTIRQLVEKRHVLLQQIASEHNLSVKNLSDAFGDWCQCHDQPHLYQWLFSEHFPPRVEDSIVRSARRRRIEVERAELMDELSRTVNRLDDAVREVRSIELRLRELPLEMPIVERDYRSRETLRDELVTIDGRLAWLVTRDRLNEECRGLQLRLEQLLSGTRRVSALRDRATHWLELMSGGRLNHLLAGHGIGLFDQHHHDETLDPYRWDRATSNTERNLVSLAVRMAAADMLGRRGIQLPLMLDDPPAGWFGFVDSSPLMAAWSRFTEAGNQLIAFTAHRGLVENIRSCGGFVQSLNPSRYYHMRYRDSWDEQEPSLGQVNRELDTVWREANGFYDDPHWYRSPDQRANNQYRYDIPNQSYDYHNSDWSNYYPPKPPYQNYHDPNLQSRGGRGPASPFFLTEDSPVDRAPSIDAVAAQRLIRLGIETVGQLLAAEPVRLASRLELADVSPDVVTRWQHEASLVCGVPQLRNFDARVLVGCGFTSPSQLAKMHPGRLLERVEAFLATDRGRQILRSGSSYELSRITSWIAAANRSVAKEERRPVEFDVDLRRERRTKKRRPEQPSRVASRERVADESRTSISSDDARYERSSQRTRREHQGERRRRPVAAAASQQPKSRKSTTATRNPVSSGLRFYLNRESAIVDAPSIGPKTADKLQAIGVRTVDHLLKSDPAQLADRLGNPRITSDRIIAWQREATLVCRVPMLRGHDAQLLVAAGIHEPERLAQCAPDWLLLRIEPIARSAEGKRVLRGARRPDLAEVSDWIRWAKEHRTLRAA